MSISVNDYLPIDNMQHAERFVCSSANIEERYRVQAFRYACGDSSSFQGWIPERPRYRTRDVRRMHQRMMKTRKIKPNTASAAISIWNLLADIAHVNNGIQSYSISQILKKTIDFHDFVSWCTSLPASCRSRGGNVNGVLRPRIDDSRAMLDGVQTPATSGNDIHCTGVNRKMYNFFRSTNSMRIIAIVFVALWVFGMITGTTLGGFIHGFLICAAMVFLLANIRGPYM